MTRPVLALTLGDVAGIGPEITARTLLHHPDLREKAVPVVVGDADVLRRGCETIGADPSAVRVLDDPREATNDPGTIEVFKAGPSLAHVPFGELEREVDQSWDPPVTLAVRLVSVVNDITQHAGQAAYAAGIIARA